MTLKAHFDGKVLVPDEPVNLPVNCALEIHVKLIRACTTATKPLLRLLALARQFPVTGGPADGAAQPYHYLYGLPKRS